jgi:hypothetical protein
MSFAFHTQTGRSTFQLQIIPIGVRHRAVEQVLISVRTMNDCVLAWCRAIFVVFFLKKNIKNKNNVLIRICQSIPNDNVAVGRAFQIHADSRRQRVGSFSQMQLYEQKKSQHIFYKQQQQQ